MVGAMAQGTGTSRAIKWLVAGLVVATVASRLAVTWRLWDPDRSGKEYGNIASHLADGEGYKLSLNHFWSSDPPVMTTRWMTPFYPLVLAGSKLLTPEKPQWYLDVYIAQSLLAGVIVWLLYALGSRLYSPGAGLLAGAIFCLTPNFAYYAAQAHPMYWELTALLLALLACRAFVAGGGTRYVVACALATIWAIYTRSAWTLLVPIVALLTLAVERDRRRALRAIALFVGLVALGVSPWAIRNLVTFGSPGLTCLEFPFWEGHNSLGEPTGYGPDGRNISNVRDFHPREWAELNAVRDQGETAIMGVFRDSARRAIRERPWHQLAVLPATRAKYFLFWDPNHHATLDWTLYRFPYLTILGLGVAGLVLSAWRPRESRRFIFISVLGVWMAGCATVAVFHYLPRFRMPAELMLMLPAGYCLARALGAVGACLGMPLSKSGTGGRSSR